MSEPKMSANELIAEQLSHTIDLLRAEIEKLRAEQEHQRQMNHTRLARLEKDSEDHEQRLRVLADSAASFKTWSGLATGGSSIAAVIALIKAWFFTP